jgi:hypothetical protein
MARLDGNMLLMSRMRNAQPIARMLALGEDRNATLRMNPHPVGIDGPDIKVEIYNNAVASLDVEIANISKRLAEIVRDLSNKYGLVHTSAAIIYADKVDSNTIASLVAQLYGDLRACHKDTKKGEHWTLAPLPLVGALNLAPHSAEDVERAKNLMFVFKDELLEALKEGFCREAVFLAAVQKLTSGLHESIGVDGLENWSPTCCKVLSILLHLLHESMDGECFTRTKEEVKEWLERVKKKFEHSFEQLVQKAMRKHKKKSEKSTKKPAKPTRNLPSVNGDEAASREEEPNKIQGGGTKKNGNERWVPQKENQRHTQTEMRSKKGRFLQTEGGSGVLTSQKSEPLHLDMDGMLALLQKFTFISFVHVDWVQGCEVEVGVIYSSLHGDISRSLWRSLSRVRHYAICLIPKDTQISFEELIERSRTNNPLSKRLVIR